MRGLDGEAGVVHFGEEKLQRNTVVLLNYFKSCHLGEKVDLIRHCPQRQIDI